MHDTQIQAEIFQINPAVLPTLYSYTLELGSLEGRPDPGWKFAHQLRKNKGGIWVYGSQKLISDIAISASEWPQLLRECWQVNAHLSVILAVETVAQPCGAKEQALFVSNGLIHKYNPHFAQVLAPTHVSLGDAKVIRKLELKDWVAHGQAFVSFSLSSEIQTGDDLAQTLAKYPRLSPLGLKVRGRLDSIQGTIVKDLGPLSAHRERLMSFLPEKAKAEAIRSDPDSLPVLSIKTRSSSYDYPAQTLQLVIEPKLYADLNINGKKILAAQRLKPAERWALISQCIAPLQKEGLLAAPLTQAALRQPLEQNLRLGQDQICAAEDRSLLKKLKQFGLYAPSPCAPAVHTRVFYLCTEREKPALKAQLRPFLEKLNQECSAFGIQLTSDQHPMVALKSGHRRDLEQAVSDSLQSGPVDLVLALIPPEVQQEPESELPSVYADLKKILLKQGVQSQMVSTRQLLGKNRHEQPAYHDALTPIVLGILAKTGQVPYVLANPLNFTDYIVGLDISRKIKSQRPGSTNIAAATHIFSNDGKIIGFHVLPADALEGETLSRSVLEALFPYETFQGKRVVVHRDGPFRGSEKQEFARWGQEIGAQFYLVAVIKTGVPRLYRRVGTQISKPIKGDLIRINENQALLVSSLPPFENGTPRPLKIESDGQLPFEQVIESILKLTLLHYGSLHAPRLPVSLHFSDQMAWLAHRGIRPSQAVGSIPYWI